ncbi:dTMP kinase [Candidatus Gottesmanbacteria bacterium]|nr:dTMP kinase [Candidatus Gottesmanbacteria bacterium]
MKGKFIVFEGISGTGKETQAKLLQEYLTKKGVDATIVYHPSIELKKILSAWRKERQIDSMTEAYLLLADRSDHVRRIIKPALASGTWIISLRSWISALVYQGKTKQDQAWITSQFQRFEPVADMIYYFTIDPSVALSRIRKRHALTGERIGKFETLQYLTEKCDRYDTVLGSIPHFFIDASKREDDVQRMIQANLKMN